jgi:hypothetical protein
MPAVVVDSVVVTGGWDPSALERGLAASTARIQRFVQDTANTKIGVQLELIGGGTQQFRTTLTDLEGLLGTFRARAAADLQLPAPTLDPHPATAALETIVAAATAADAQLAALRATLPSPDTTAIRQALAGVLGSIAAVQEGLAALNGQRIRIDAGDLSARLDQLRTQLADIPAVTVPVALETGNLGAVLQQEVARLPSLRVPLTLDTSTAIEALAVLVRQVAALPATRLAVTVDTTSVAAALAGLERQLVAVTGVAVPVRLDVGPVEQALAGIERQLQGLGPVTLPVQVSADLQAVRELLATLRDTSATIPVRIDAAQAAASLAEIRARLGAVDPLVVPARLDAAGVATGLAELSRQLAAVGAVTVPVTLATGPVAEAIAGIERQLAAVPGVTLPVRVDVGAAEQALAALEAQLTAIGPLTVPVTVQADVAAARALLESLRAPDLTVPVTLDATALTASLAAVRERLAVVEPVVVPLQLSTADLARSLAGIEQQLTGIPGPVLPIQLDLGPATEALRALDAQVASIGPLVLPVELTANLAAARDLLAGLRPVVDVTVALDARAAGAAFDALQRRLTDLTPVAIPVTLQTATLGAAIADVERQLAVIPPAVLPVQVDLTAVTAAVRALETQLTALGPLTVPVTLATDVAALRALLADLRTETATVPVTLDTATITASLADLRSRLAAIPPVTVPVTVETGQLVGLVAEAQRTLATLQPVSVPVILDGAGLTRGLADLQRQLATLTAVQVPVTLDMGNVAAAVADLERQLTTVLRPSVPIQLDLTSVAASVDALQAQLDALKGVVLPVEIRADLATIGDIIDALRATVVEIPVRANTAGLVESLADIRRRLRAVDPVVVPVALGTSNLAAAIADLSRRLVVSPLRIPVELNVAALQGAVAGIERQVSGLQALTLPVRLDVAAVDDALAAIRAQVASLPPITVPVSVGTADTGGTAAALQELTDTINGIVGALAPVAGAFQDFFAGVIQGAQEEAAAIQASTQAVVAGLSAQVNAARRAAEANATAQAAGAGVGGGAALAAVQATVGFTGLANAQARVASGSRAMADGIANLSRQTKILTDVEAALATGTGRVAAGFALSSEQIRIAAAASESAAQKVDQVAGAAGRSGQGLKSMASSLASLGAQATGTQSQIASLATQFLFFGVGGPIVLGLAATAAAAAITYELITRKTHEAQKATEDFIAAQVKAARGRDVLGSVREAFAGVDEAERHIEGLTARLVRLNAELADLRKGSTVTTEAGDALHFVDEASIDKQIQKIKDLRTAVLETGLGFLDPILKAQRSAADQATHDDLAITQQGIALRLDALKAGYTQELTTRAEFFKQSRSLAAVAAGADLAALQADLARAQAARAHANIGTDLVERTALDAQVRGLQAQITLREGLLGLQRQQITNEETLAKLATLERAGIGEIGGRTQVQIPAFLQLHFENVLPDVDQMASLISLRLATGIAVNLGREDFKPRLDLTEINAALDRFAADTPRFQLENDFERARRAGIALQPVLDEINLKLKDIGNANVDANPFKSFADQAGDVIDGISRIGNALEDVGLLSRQAAQDFAVLVDLGKSIASGDIAGIIAGGINLIGSVAGPSEAERERNRILGENNDLLRRNNAELANRQGGIRKLGADQLALAQLLASGLLRGVQSTGVPIDAPGRSRTNPIGQGLRDELNRQLAAAGLDIREFADQIKQATGISILDDKGRIVAAAFDQAKEAIDKMVDAATHFSTSFADQLDFSALQAKISGGIGDAVDQFTRDLEAAGTVKAPFIETFFNGIDIRRDADAFQKRLQELLALFAPDSDFFAKRPELLGGLTPEDWRKILNDGADAMAELIAQTQALTRSFADQLASTQLRSRLAGEDQDPAAAFQREINTLLATFGNASPAIAQQLANLNLGDPTAVRQALLSLFDQVAAGGLGLSADALAALNQFLNDGAGFLDSFNQGLQDATKRLGDLNIPQGFRRAALAFQNASLGPDLGAPAAVIHVDIPPVPIIAPLPADMQAVLDTIAGTTPPDLLQALDRVTAAAGTAPQRLLDALAGVQAATAEGPQRILDALHGIRSAVEATQIPPADTTRTSAGPTPQPSPTAGVVIQRLEMNVTQLPGESGEDFGDRVVQRLERLGVLRTGSTQAFGPF